MAATLALAQRASHGDARLRGPIPRREEPWQPLELHKAQALVDGAGVRSCTNLPKAANFSNLDTWWPRGQCILDGEYKGAKGAPISDNYFRNWVMKSGQYGARFANTDGTERIPDTNAIPPIDTDRGSSPNAAGSLTRAAS